MRRMFETDQLIADCRAALREPSPQLAIKEIVERAVAQPGDVERALGTPKRAEMVTLYRSPDLTVLNLIWGPCMSLYPHDHRMWAVIGLYGGRPLVERRGRLLHLGPERFDRAERWFDRHDRWAVLLGRVTPVVRSFVSMPAGVFEMPLAPYTLFTLIGSALWAFAFAAIGYAVGSNYERFHHFFDIALVAGVALLVLYLLVRRVSRLKRAS